MTTIIVPVAPKDSRRCDPVRYVAEVEAEVINDVWAVTKAAGAEPGPGRKWRVTHLPTGERCGRWLLSKAEARKIARRLARDFSSREWHAPRWYDLPLEGLREAEAVVRGMLSQAAIESEDIDVYNNHPSVRAATTEGETPDTGETE